MPLKWLPQLLYLFQNIPVFLPKSFLRLLDTIVVLFLWSYKTHRISRRHLIKSKERGGLAFLDFLLYYWASHIRIITYWLHDTATIPSWLVMERETCRPYSMVAILLYPLTIDKSLFQSNVMIHTTLRIWKQIRSHFNLELISYALPIAENPTFVPSTLDNTFKSWKKVGINTIRDLCIEGTFCFLHTITEWSQTARK